jgi:hypothetical protein
MEIDLPAERQRSGMKLGSAFAEDLCGRVHGEVMSVCWDTRGRLIQLQRRSGDE